MEHWFTFFLRFKLESWAYSKPNSNFGIPAPYSILKWWCHYGFQFFNNTDTYTENKWEISCSCFPHFQCIVIDSCNHMLIPQIPPDLIQQKMEHFSVWSLITKIETKVWKILDQQFLHSWTPHTSLYKLFCYAYFKIIQFITKFTKSYHGNSWLQSSDWLFYWWWTVRLNKATL